MATKLTMPKLGLTMLDGEIKEWRKKEGEQLVKGEILYVLETEKVKFEVEAPESGILGKIIARVNDVVSVGGTVAYLLQRGEKLEDIPDLAAVTAKAEQIKAPSASPGPTALKAQLTQDIRISPLARRIAEEQHLDINTLKGTGPEGRIVKEDVLRTIEGRNAVAARQTAEKASSQGNVVPLSSMRKTIARRMTESFQTTPHFWVTDEADASESKRLLQQLQPLVEKQSGVRLTYTDLLIKIVAKALQEHPSVNTSWTNEGIKFLEEINIGIATEVPGGLIVPVVRRANEKSLAEIATSRSDLVTRGRQGKVGIDEMMGGTFTLNNVGALGIKCVNAIINPPQSAILTLGKIMDKPVVVKGEIVVRPVMELNLGADHRVLDGASGARFLSRVKELIENPALLLL